MSILNFEMKYAKRLLFFIIVISIPLSGYLFYWNKNVVSLSVVFTSDGHGHILPSTAYWQEDKSKIGGLAALGGFLSGLDVPCLLTDSGDIYQGTPEGVLTKGRIVVEIMNILGYDAVAAGNHEFSLGQDVLRNLSEAADFPILGANITEEDTGNVPGYFKKHLLKRLEGIKIGITGVITPDMENLSLRDNIEGLEFLDPVEAINNNVKILREEGAEIIIVLSHLGLDQDKEIATEVNGVDVILGGHTHIRMDDPVKINRILICQPGCHFTNAGYLKLYYSIAEKKILTYYHRLVPLYVDRFLPHEGVLESIEEMHLKVSEELDKIIGVSKVFLSNHLSGEQRKHGEFALGNWQVDLMREVTESDFAFQNTGGIRSSILQGDIKVRDIWELSPFGNTLVQMVLTGEQIKRLLEQSASQKYSKLQVSGLKMIYNDSLPEGSRILNIIVTDDEGEKKELDVEKEYTVVTNSFLTQGGDGYTVFQEGKDINETAIILRELEIDYIEKKSPIFAEVEGRLVNVNIEK